MKPSGLFDVESIDIYGLKSDIVLLPYGRLKQFSCTCCRILSPAS